MSDMIERAEVIRIIERRFSGTMLGDILKADVDRIPAVRTGDRISRCELFNRLATVTAEDPNDMKAKIYAVIQEMEAGPDIVRCKECRAYNEDGYCDLMDRDGWKADDFCSYAERSE